MTEMTISEVLRDPLIRLVLRADGTSLSTFAHLLKAAARERQAAHRNIPAVPYFPTAKENPARH